MNEMPLQSGSKRLELASSSSGNTTTKQQQIASPNTKTNSSSLNFLSMSPPTKQQLEQEQKSIREATSFIPYCNHNSTHVSWILHEATKYMPLFDASKSHPNNNNINNTSDSSLNTTPAQMKTNPAQISSSQVSQSSSSSSSTSKPKPKSKSSSSSSSNPAAATQKPPQQQQTHAQIDQSLSERNDALIESISLTFWQGRHFCKGIRYLQAAMYSKRKQEEEEQKKSKTISSTSSSSAPPDSKQSATATTKSNHDAFTFLRHARVTFKKLSLFSPIAQLLNVESTLFLAAEAAMNSYKDKVVPIDKEAMEVLNRFYITETTSSSTTTRRPLNFLCYSDGIARALNNIGNVFENQIGDLRTAYERKRQSLECFKLFYSFSKNNRNPDNMVVASVSTNLGLMLLDVINASPATTTNNNNNNSETHADALQFMRDGVSMMKRFFEKKQKLENRKAKIEGRQPKAVITDDENERFASALNSLGGCLQQTHVTTSDQIEEEAIPFLRDALRIREDLWKKERDAAENSSSSNNEDALNATISSSSIVPKLIASLTNLGNALGFTANHRGEGIELLRRALELGQEAATACEKILLKDKYQQKPEVAVESLLLTNEQFRGHQQRLAMTCANLGSALMEVPACQVESQDHVKRAIDIYEKLISTFPSPTTTVSAPSSSTNNNNNNTNSNNDASKSSNTFKVTKTTTNKTGNPPPPPAATTPAPPLPVNPEKIRLMESRAVSILNLGLIAEKLDRNFDRALQLKKQALELRFKCFVSRTHQDHKLPQTTTSSNSTFDIDKMIIENDNNKNIVITDAAIAANLCNVGESLAFHPHNDDEVKQGVVYLRKSIEILDRIASHNCNKLLAVSSLLPHLDPKEAESVALANLPLFDSYLQTAATFHRVDIAKAFSEALKQKPDLFQRINLIKLAAAQAREVENGRIAEATREMNRKKFLKKVEEDKRREKEERKKNGLDDDEDSEHGTVHGELEGKEDDIDDDDGTSSVKTAKAHARSDDDEEEESHEVIDDNDCDDVEKNKNQTFSVSHLAAPSTTTNSATYYSANNQNRKRNSGENDDDNDDSPQQQRNEEHRKNSRHFDPGGAST